MMMTVMMLASSQSPPVFEQIGFIAHGEGEHLSGALGYLSKRILERTYYRIWACVRWFRGQFKEMGVDSGLEAIREESHKSVIEYLNSYYLEGRSYRLGRKVKLVKKSSPSHQPWEGVLLALWVCTMTMFLNYACTWLWSSLVFVSLHQGHKVTFWILVFSVRLFIFTREHDALSSECQASS